MNKPEAIAAIKQAKEVFAWVNLTRDEGTYLKVSKKEAAQAITDDKADYNIETRNGGGSAYIN